MSGTIQISRELIESMIEAFEYECRNEWADPLRAILDSQTPEPNEPLAYSYKEYVWATGLGSYVWREKLETERPNTEDCEIKDLVPLYAKALASNS